jgi:GH15 family glucan-1,4-alpha-glucosidase
MVEAPGRPGIPARWTSSAKDGVGAGLSERSRVWFTISHGIVNEIYYPRVDEACVRDLGFIVTDGDTFFAEVKRDCQTVVERVEDGVPAFRLTSTHRGGRFRMINQAHSGLRSTARRTMTLMLKRDVLLKRRVMLKRGRSDLVTWYRRQAEKRAAASR